jgi:hypothetical protein
MILIADLVHHDEVDDPIEDRSVGGEEFLADGELRQEGIEGRRRVDSRPGDAYPASSEGDDIPRGPVVFQREGLG